MILVLYTTLYREGGDKFARAARTLAAPIRAEHEMKWYLESRFPGRKVETVNVGLNARVLAFDSGPLEPGTVAPQGYP